MNETNEHNPDDWPDIRKPGDQSARIAELERQLKIERGEVEAGDRILKDQDEEIAELKRRVEELTEKEKRRLKLESERLFPNHTRNVERALLNAEEQLSQLRAEVERLTKERDAVSAWSGEVREQNVKMAEMVATLQRERDVYAQCNRTALDGLDALRAQLAEREEDRALLDWLIDFVQQNGADGIRNMIWTMDPDEDDIERADLLFDRAAIRAARAQEDGK